MFRRILLFLLTNFLVVITLGILLNLILPMLGIQVRGSTGLAIFCGIFGMGGAMISLLISRWIAKRAYHIQLVGPGDPLYQMVEKLARHANIPTPEVGVYPSPEVNAFATGYSKNASLVAFSEGILHQMDRREIEAVAAHEVSHIANGDMVTLALLTGVANAFVMFFARAIASVIDQFLSDEEGGGLGFFAYFIVVILLESVFMMLAYIPIAAFSRYREYRADAGSAELTSREAMIDALRRIHQQTQTVKGESTTFAMAKISSSKRASLWATHPPLEMRIRRLQGV